MAFRLKEKSRRVIIAIQRLLGMKKIDEDHKETFNYGTAQNPVTVDSYDVAVKEYNEALDKYNESLKESDRLANILKMKAAILTDYSKRVLQGVKAKFGDDATEVETIGGTRSSEKKKRKKSE